MATPRCRSCAPVLLAVVAVLLCGGVSAVLAVHLQDNSSPLQDDAGLTIQTTSGPVEGYVKEDGVRMFLGVPYAAPPVGDLRWANPVSPSSWTDVRPAKTFSAGCPQDCELPPGTCPEKVSEDCLYLNVYTPAVDKIKAPLPVLVFLHGGRFEQGAGGTFFYSGIWMANNTDIVVVTINYRMGATGFLVTDELAGNFGIEDQRFAFAWVKANIANFGGNPDDITVDGQSAGGTSIAYHLVAKNSKNLFHRAIVESNPWALPLKDVSDSIRWGHDFASKIGCSRHDVACMRSKSWEQVVQAQKDVSVFTLHFLGKVYRWSPVIGTDDVPGQPIELIQKGEFNAMPLIVGNTRDEGLMFIYMGVEKPVPRWELDIAITAIFGVNALKVLEEYKVPANMTSDTRPILAEMGTDYMFACPNRAVIRSLNMFSHYPSYAYFFDRVLPWPNAWGPMYPYCDGQVCHGSELVYVFNSAWSHDPAWEFTSGGKVLSECMGAYWGSFVGHNDPNYEAVLRNCPRWSPWDLESEEGQVLDVPISSTRRRYETHCDFWDKIGYIHS